MALSNYLSWMKLYGVIVILILWANGERSKKFPINQRKQKPNIALESLPTAW